MDTWTLQKGYPVVTLSRDRSSSMRNVNVKQSHFTIQTEDPDININDSPYRYQWFIYFAYLTHTNRTPKGQWLEMNSTNIEMKIDYQGNWILGNKDKAGFYRVNYENDNWDALTDQLQRDHTEFSPSTRAAILDDAFALQRAGLLDTNRALSVTLYLDRENDYLPWMAAMKGFNYIRKRMYTTESYGLLQNYIKQKAGHLVALLGWGVGDNYGTLGSKGNLQQRFLRTLTLKTLCENGDEEAVSQAVTLFDNWLNKDEEIPADLKSFVYFVGVMKGDSEVWDTIEKDR
ncbi:thyrotropin-releasing hormone-degrading ectoenzyme-like [Ptychodera flava]|uniref:thyrotropin-releasing hormone-degrading ectoenzyme-like n=1 Tax=Ptychodera flava TaxID=63121 RepID=UPI003969F918